MYDFMIMNSEFMINEFMIMNFEFLCHIAYGICNMTVLWHKNSNIWLFSLQRFDSFATFLQPPSSKLFSKPHKISLNPKP